LGFPELGAEKQGGPPESIVRRSANNKPSSISFGDPSLVEDQVAFWERAANYALSTRYEQDVPKFPSQSTFSLLVWILETCIVKVCKSAMSLSSSSLTSCSLEPNAKGGL